MKFFKNIKFNAKVIVCSDNKNNTFNRKTTNSRTERWRWKLQEFRAEFKHVSGIDDKAADLFSRNNEVYLMNEEQTEEFLKKL